MIIAAITPSVTAMAISGEKEKQTYEMFLATPLSPGNILWGKFIAAMGYVFLIVFAAIPLASLVFVFGGVAVREMLKALVILVTVAVMFGVIGLFSSALFGRSGRSTAIAYLIVVFLFGPTLVAAGAGMLNQTNPPRWMLVLSPTQLWLPPFRLQSTFNSLPVCSGCLAAHLVGFPANGPISFTSIPRPVYHYSLPIFLTSPWCFT